MNGIKMKKTCSSKANAKASQMAVYDRLRSALMAGSGKLCATFIGASYLIRVKAKLTCLRGVPVQLSFQPQGACTGDKQQP